MAEFELRIETDTDEKAARLKLFRADGTHLGSNEIRLPGHSSALWEGLFDTRCYVQRYEGSMIFDDQPEPATARTLLERLGLFLGEKVLGEGIVRALAGPERRVLVVRLPTTDEDVLADLKNGYVASPGIAPTFEEFVSDVVAIEMSKRDQICETEVGDDEDLDAALERIVDAEERGDQCRGEEGTVTLEGALLNVKALFFEEGITATDLVTFAEEEATEALMEETEEDVKLRALVGAGLGAVVGVVFLLRVHGRERSR